MKHTDDIDSVTGVHTTGHVWDGDIKELNKPLPKWWLYTFYATVIWAIGYWIAYPAWPTVTGYTQGVLGYSQRARVAAAIHEGKMEQAKFLDAIGNISLPDIPKNPDLLNFTRSGGAAVFASHCAGCHGRGGQGAPGYPNLLDDDWIWGGTLEDIHLTIIGGARSGHKLERNTAMPRFGTDKILTAAEIADTAEFVLALSSRSKDADSSARGQKIFADQCSACHGPDGKGNQSLGAPNLTDPIWLYGAEKKNIVESIATGRGGMMPSWDGRFDPATLKMLAVYVHALGGGK